MCSLYDRSCDQAIGITKPYTFGAEYARHIKKKKVEREVGVGKRRGIG